MLYVKYICDYVVGVTDMYVKWICNRVVTIHMVGMIIIICKRICDVFAIIWLA